MTGRRWNNPYDSNSLETTARQLAAVYTVVLQFTTLSPQNSSFASRRVPPSWGGAAAIHVHYMRHILPGPRQQRVGQ